MYLTTNTFHVDSNAERMLLGLFAFRIGINDRDVTNPIRIVDCFELLFGHLGTKSGTTVANPYIFLYSFIVLLGFIGQM